MEKKPYHDTDNYIDDEYDDDFDIDKSKQPVKEEYLKNVGEEDIKRFNESNKKRRHITDTSNYNSFEFEIVSPEDADKESKELFKHGTSPDYADPVIAQAVYQIENKTGKKITYDEFDKLCKTYAAELVDRDAKYRGTDEPNPIDYKMYYDTLIQNKKVKPAYEMRMSKYENSLVEEIDQLMSDHKIFDDKDIHVDIHANLDHPINVRHKGKVFIKDEAHNQEIKIDNKKDVDLLRMRYRKDWLDKKYKHDIDSEINGVHSNDGFE